MEKCFIFKEIIIDLKRMNCFIINVIIIEEEDIKVTAKLFFKVHQ